ncbi:MAG: FixH family protein [bacterium]
MEHLALSIGAVVVLEFVAFSLLYKYTSWQGKQVAFLIILVTLAIYFPYGILNWKGLDLFAIHFAFYVTIPYVLGIITSNWEIRERIEGPSRTKWFHWGPATMVVFFIVIATVDSAIISFAQDGMSSGVARWLLPEPASKGAVNSFFPGVVSHDFFKNEAEFNRYLEQRKMQEERGWQVKKGWVGDVVAGQAAKFQISVVAKEGAPVSGAKVSALFWRPSDQRLDQNLAMEETAGHSGVYTAEVTLPVGGKWEVVVTIEKGDALHEVRAATKIAGPSR